MNRITSKILEQNAFNTGPKNEQHMLMVMDKSVHEEHSFQPLKTNIKQFKVDIFSLTADIELIIVTNSINKIYFGKSITNKDGSIQITIPPGNHETEKLNNEIKRIIIEEEHLREANIPSTIKANSWTIGSMRRNFQRITIN